MFTPKQILQLEAREISLEQASGQLEIFKKGIEPVRLVRPAVPDNGIEVYERGKIDYYVNLFQNEKHKFSFVKFVPASGAASRMFKSLFEALSDFLNNPHDVDSSLKKNKQVFEFFENLNFYPFYDDLVIICKSRGLDPLALIKSREYAEILNLLLSNQGLAYGELPKGLLKFHNYSDDARTAFEEHFAEAAMFLKDAKNKVKIHFTVSQEHLELFQTLAETLISKYLKKSKIHFEIEFSVQKPSTDTIAVDMDNKPFILSNGTLLFRPGGHGALLNNMQDINENIVFVGNIDNVAPDRTKPLRVRYKELLAGILIERMQTVYTFLNKIETGCSAKLMQEIIDFIKKYLSETSVLELKNLSEDEFIKVSRKILNRPIRVCGMVKNVGEPGGGPFWVSDSSGNISKQIVESSQVNLNNPEQNTIFQKATHFNPVDIVCSITNYKGKRFNLEEFRDPEMAFIAVKSQGGSSVKALELPGLWNGSMAGWLTFFVDVPVETFSPVKTIFDLRREEHLS